MLSPSYSISPKDLWNAIGDAVGAADRRCAAARRLRCSRRNCCRARSGAMPARRKQWSAELDRARPIVAACKAGHEMSQTAVAQLRADGFDARVLEGGYEAWAKAGLPLVAKAELDRIAPTRPSLWVTRRRPKIDRIACPWLIRRFLDGQARILFVDPDRGAERRARERRRAVRHQGRRIEPRGRTLHASTPCSSCSAWKASRRWRGWR